MFRPSGEHCMLQRVLRAVHTVVTPGCTVRTNPTPVSGEDQRQAEREDVVVSLQPLLEEGPYRRDCGVLKIERADSELRKVKHCKNYLSKLIRDL